MNSPYDAEQSEISQEDPYMRSLATQLLVHAAIVDWFSRLFIAPLDQQVLKDYRAKDFSHFLDDFGETIEATPLTSMIVLVFNGQSIDEVERDLSHQYVTLFDGFSGPYAVPSYESYYMNEEGRLYQTPYDEMTEVLSDLDVSIVQSCKEPADHLALELAALAEALRQQNVAYIEELTQRIASWIPQMNVAMQRVAKTNFYAQILNLLIIYFSSLNNLVSQDEDAVKH